MGWPHMLLVSDLVLHTLNLVACSAQALFGGVTLGGLRSLCTECLLALDALLLQFKERLLALLALLLELVRQAEPFHVAFFDGRAHTQRKRGEAVRALLMSLCNFCVGGSLCLLALLSQLRHLCL